MHPLNLRATLHCIVSSMHLPLSLLVAILCTQLSVDGFSSRRVSNDGVFGMLKSRCNQIKQERQPRSSSTELSAGSILPTVYSAIAVASVIAFHEAGKPSESLSK